MGNELIQSPAWRMAEFVRGKEVSPVELAEAHFKHIERLNPLLNAFVDLRRDAALADARAVEAKLQAGEDAGPLAGVPMSIKSCIDVAGMKCEAGSKLRAGNVP